MRRLQIGLMVYHFRYNVGYQTYLVLLTKYLLHPQSLFQPFLLLLPSDLRNFSIL